MPAPPLRPRELIPAAILLLTCVCFVTASDESTLNKEQIKQFLLTAKVVKSEHAKKGITDTLRLTLSDGTVTHDASFQAIDEHQVTMETVSGTELNFVDSYKYNIAAYELSELLGIDDMLPVYVERTWQGKTGSLSWWLPVKMDEVERHKQHLQPPDQDAWNKQMYKIRVLDELVYDTDTNLTNVLIGDDWKIWRVDFSRAFRRSRDVENSKNLIRCDRQLFEKLKTLDGKELRAKTKGYLNQEEVKGVMARRDKIVATFQKLISEKGESEVLY
jgi:hypothetical protein